MLRLLVLLKEIRAASEPLAPNPAGRGCLGVVGREGSELCWLLAHQQGIYVYIYI